LISITEETVIPLSKVGDYCPSTRAGKRVHATTAWRWGKAGCRALDGSLVKLETIRIGSTNCTSVQALQRFFERLTVQQVPGRPMPDFEARQDLIERKLAAFGL
jgi:hypothetical protein